MRHRARTMLYDGWWRVLFVALLVGLSGCEQANTAEALDMEARGSLEGLCGGRADPNLEVTSVRPNEWFVLYGSYVHTFETDICDEWARLGEAGLNPKLAWSDALPSFRPGWIVLVEGPMRPDSAHVRAARLRSLVPNAHAWPGW